METTVVRRWSDLVAILIGEFHLPVAAIRFQCRERRGIAKGNDTLIHAWYGVGVADDHCIEPAVVHTKSDCSVLLGVKTKGVAHYVCDGSITSIANMSSISCFSIPVRVGRVCMVPKVLGIPLLNLVSFGAWLL